MKICIIHCFDTYEHRVDLLHDYFKERGAEVTVITSDYMHFEKRKRTDKKEDFHYIKAVPYASNLSLTRLWSHLRLSKNIFAKIESKEYDLLCRTVLCGMQPSISVNIGKQNWFLM